MQQIFKCHFHSNKFLQQIIKWICCQIELYHLIWNIDEFSLLWKHSQPKPLLRLLHHPQQTQLHHKRNCHLPKLNSEYPLIKLNINLWYRDLSMADHYWLRPNRLLLLESRLSTKPWDNLRKNKHRRTTTMPKRAQEDKTVKPKWILRLEHLTWARGSN